MRNPPEHCFIVQKSSNFKGLMGRFILNYVFESSDHRDDVEGFRCVLNPRQGRGP